MSQTRNSHTIKSGSRTNAIESLMLTGLESFAPAAAWMGTPFNSQTNCSPPGDTTIVFDVELPEDYRHSRMRQRGCCFR
jgi:hypothetical protein